MTAGRKPGGLSFRVIEGGRDLHRQPLVPAEPAPCIGCWIVAGAVVMGIVGLAAWIATWPRWGRL